MASGDFDLQLDAAAIEDLGFSDEVRDLAQDVGDQVADTARGLAPKKSGEGADSIHAEVGEDSESVYADVSWNRDHFYMLFHELGTEKMAARPFLRPALDQAKI